MRKLMKRLLAVALFAAFFWCGMLIADRIALRSELIRLHVVANSDSVEDQDIKLQVRDAVVERVRQGMTDVQDMEQAMAYLRENLPQIEAVANETLQKLGCTDAAVVSLAEEAFPTRDYDTFSLPAGVYETLRIVIGQGEGHNWWCVVFPQLCLTATSAEAQDTAVSAGFSEGLTSTLTGEDGYEFRFFLLECLGKIENFFHGA